MPIQVDFQRRDNFKQPRISDLVSKGRSCDHAKHGCVSEDFFHLISNHKFLIKSLRQPNVISGQGMVNFFQKGTDSKSSQLCASRAVSADTTHRGCCSRKAVKNEQGFVPWTMACSPLILANAFGVTICF